MKQHYYRLLDYNIPYVVKLPYILVKISINVYCKITTERFLFKNKLQGVHKENLIFTGRIRIQQKSGVLFKLYFYITQLMIDDATTAENPPYSVTWSVEQANQTA